MALAIRRQKRKEFITVARVSRTTTINNQEYVPEKGGIGFSPELIKIIMSGQKLSTYRFGKKYHHLKVGDTVRIENSDTGEVACLAKVTDKSMTTFKDLPISGNSHETFRDKE